MPWKAVNKNLRSCLCPFACTFEPVCNFVSCFSCLVREVPAIQYEIMSKKFNLCNICHFFFFFLSVLRVNINECLNIELLTPVWFHPFCLHFVKSYLFDCLQFLSSLRRRQSSGLFMYIDCTEWVLSCEML